MTATLLHRWVRVGIMGHFPNQKMASFLQNSYIAFYAHKIMDSYRVRMRFTPVWAATFDNMTFIIEQIKEEIK